MAMGAGPTMNGVVRDDATGDRQHPDHSRGNPNASPPSLPPPLGCSEDLVKRRRRGAEAFFVFAHTHEDLSTI